MSPCLISTVYAGPLPGGATLAATVVLAAGVVATYALLMRGENPWRRLASGALRLGALAAAAVVLAGPSMAVRTPASRRPAVAVLVDDTASLAVPDAPGPPPGMTRLAEARYAVARLADGLGEFDDRAAVEWYRFAGEISALGDSGLVGDGAETAVGGALEAAWARERPSRLAAVVVVSDGAQNAGPDATSTAEMVAAGATRIHTVSLGRPSDLVDGAVTSLEAPVKARVRDSVPVRAVVRVTGGRGRKMAVALEADGKEVESRTFTPSSDEETRPVEFRYVVGTSCVHRLVVKVAFADGGPADALPHNDSRVTFVTSMEGPLKVMLAAGALGWDYGAVRSALSAHPEVRLETARAFLRESQELDAAARRWDEFHVVVLLGVSGDELPRTEWQRLADLVRGGSGLLVALGERSAGLSRTPLADVLPVRLSPNARAVDGEGRAVLTASGASHTAAAITENPAARRSAWSALTALPSRLPVGSVPEGAKVLVADEAGEPIVVVAEAGAGRTLAILSSESHAWRRGDEASRETYGSFVRAAVRYLAGLGAAAGKRGRLWPERHAVWPGERLGLHAEIAPGEQSAGSEILVVAKGCGDRRRRVRLGRAGRHHWGEIVLDEPGEHDLELLVGGESADTSKVVVRSAEWEMRSPRADHELLERISEVSGGISVDSRRVDEVVAAIGSALPGAGAGGVRHEPVWDSGAFLALIILLLSAEWWLSRR